MADSPFTAMTSVLRRACTAGGSLEAVDMVSLTCPGMLLLSIRAAVFCVHSCKVDMHCASRDCRRPWQSHLLGAYSGRDRQHG